MVKNILTHILSLLEKENYSPKILSRLEKDLQKVYTRLESGQYEYHDYSGENTFQVDERTQDFFLYLKSYAETGRLWERILKNIEVYSFSSIVDLCCGWAPKITLALFYLDYKGKLILLDKDTKALDDLESFMSEVFRPNYTLIKEQRNLEEGTETYECIIANHVFDDLILSFYCKEKNIPDENIYTDEGFLKGIWQEISGDMYFLEKIPTQLANIFDTLMLEGGVICFSQYESMMERIMQNNISVNTSREVMHKTKELLISQGYTNISEKALGGVENISPQEYLILKK